MVTHNVVILSCILIRRGWRLHHLYMEEFLIWWYWQANSMVKIYWNGNYAFRRFMLPIESFHYYHLPDGILFHWFCKCTPPWMFLPLDIPSEYRPEHVTFGLLCVIFKFPSRIFCRRVPGFATDCPCGVWCRGLTTCLLYVGPPLEF